MRQRITKCHPAVTAYVSEAELPKASKPKADQVG
jgi:hypothetical protein